MSVFFSIRNRASIRIFFSLFFSFAKELESFAGKIQLKKDVSRQKRSRYAASYKEARSRQNVCNTELFLPAKKKDIEKEE